MQEDDRVSRPEQRWLPLAICREEGQAHGGPAGGSEGLRGCASRQSAAWWRQHFGLVLDGVALTKAPRPLNSCEKHAAQAIQGVNGADLLTFQTPVELARDLGTTPFVAKKVLKLRDEHAALHA